MGGNGTVGSSGWEICQPHDFHVPTNTHHTSSLTHLNHLPTKPALQVTSTANIFHISCDGLFGPKGTMHRFPPQKYG